MRYLICYDIAETKIRTRVAKYLERFAIRIQYSVFTCESTENDMKAVKKTLENITKHSEKKMILLLPVCQACESRAMTIGTALEPLSYCVIV